LNYLVSIPLFNQAIYRFILNTTKNEKDNCNLSYRYGRCCFIQFLRIVQGRLQNEPGLCRIRQRPLISPQPFGQARSSGPTPNSTEIFFRKGYHLITFFVACHNHPASRACRTLWEKDRLLLDMGDLFSLLAVITASNFSKL
jgi:hypothetical protein